jgi:hypothetical protein
MPQMPVMGPFRESDLGDQLWLDPGQAPLSRWVGDGRLVPEACDELLERRAPRPYPRAHGNVDHLPAS